ncbi:MAG TPA: YdcH family protein [Dissulfurispiraceae bacterium]|nr:YdcH family protein [Dissulfurispiraceae bacterium]
MREEEIVEALKSQNEDFRKLYQEHRSLDVMLADFNSRHYLSPEEELEKKRLQKEKLFKKDKIAALIRDYQAHQPTV